MRDAPVSYSEWLLALAFFARDKPHYSDITINKAARALHRYEHRVILAKTVGDMLLIPQVGQHTAKLLVEFKDYYMAEKP